MLRKQVSGNDVGCAGNGYNIRVSEIAIPNDRPVRRDAYDGFRKRVPLDVFGHGFALFLEYLDDTIRTTEEVENYLQHAGTRGELPL